MVLLGNAARKRYDEISPVLGRYRMTSVIMAFVMLGIVWIFRGDLTLNIYSYDFGIPVFSIALACVMTACTAIIAGAAVRRGYMLGSALVYMGNASLVIMSLHMFVAARCFAYWPTLSGVMVIVIAAGIPAMLYSVVRRFGRRAILFGAK